MNDEQHIKRLQEISAHLTDLYKDVPIYPDALLKFKELTFDMLESRKAVVSEIDLSLAVPEPDDSEYKGNLPTIETIVAFPIPWDEVEDDDDSDTFQDKDGQFSNQYKLKFFLKKTETNESGLANPPAGSFGSFLNELLNNPPQSNPAADELEVVERSLVLIQNMSQPSHNSTFGNPILLKYVPLIEKKFLHPILGIPDNGS